MCRRKELNGCEGLAEAWDAAAGRYRVVLGPGAHAAMRTHAWAAKEAARLAPTKAMRAAGVLTGPARPDEAERGGRPV